MTQKTRQMQMIPDAGLPGWVPEGAMRYLAHTERGQSIRDIARVSRCHASTILRQIRKVELRRDDPLVDAALYSLAQSHFPPGGAGPDRIGQQNRQQKGAAAMKAETDGTEGTPDAGTLEREARRILPRLCESGAVLAVAENMEKAVVVRDGPDGGSARTAVVDRSIAEAMALKDWIACKTPGRVSRYHLTRAGRRALGHMLARAENQARCAQETGLAEAQVAFRHADPGDKMRERTGRGLRQGLPESPLIGLARRRDKDGQPFLSDDLVRAGERLREDFELTRMGAGTPRNWERFLDEDAARAAPEGTQDARARVARALAELGPGLSDVALRCCCLLEGLEAAEKRMGWSARSGKIVLRIALQRLRRHYEGLSGRERMIG